MNRATQLRQCHTHAVALQHCICHDDMDLQHACIPQSVTSAMHDCTSCTDLHNAAADLLAAIVSGLIAWPLYGDAIEVLHGKPLSDGPGKQEKAETQGDAQPPSDVRDQRNDQRNDDGNVW